MSLRRLWETLVKVTSSLLCAGVFYLIWLAAFLLAAKLNSCVVEAVLWLLAPVVTAAGFATGIVIFERPANIRVFMWPLIGCAIGAG